MQEPSERSDNSQDRQGRRRRQQQSPPPRQSRPRPSSAADTSPSLRETPLPASDVKRLIAVTLAAFSPHNWRRNPADDPTPKVLNEAWGWDSAWDPPAPPDLHIEQMAETSKQAIDLPHIPNLDLSKVPRCYHMMVAGELFDRHPLYLIRNLSQFHDEDLPEIAELFLRRTPQGTTTCGYLLAANLNCFSGVNHELLFNRLLEASSDDARAAISNFDQFKGIEPQAAAWRALVIVGCADCLVDNIDKFPGIDRATLASKLQEPRIGAFTALARNAHKFPDLNHSELLTRFLQSDPRKIEIANFVKHVGNLQQIDHATFATFLTTECPDALADNIGLFPGVDRNSIAKKLMSPKIRAFPALARNIASFPDLDQKKLVQSFFRSASAQEQEPAFFSQLSRLDRVDPCWLIKAIIAYDFDSLPWLPDPFLSPSAQFDRRNFLAVLIKETEKHVKKSAQNIASASRDVIEEHETVLRLVVDDIIISLIRSTPAEQRLHLVDALVAYDDCYVAALARCLDCFEDPDLSTVIEHLAAAGQQSRVALLDAARIFDPATQAAIVMLVIESDPASISWALLDHVKTLGSSGQLLVLYQLVKLGQFDAIEELTWMIPVRDIRILRSLLENRPSCSLAKEIELPNIKSVDDEELARACRGVLEKRRGHARSSHESFDSTAKEKELRQFYRKHPSVLVALQKKSVRREILGTAELNLPTWLPAKSRTEWVETLRMHSYAAVELASNLTRIVPRKSDIPLFGPLAASGYPEEVLNILGRYPDIPPKALKHIHCAVAKGYIVAGRFEMADRFIAECSISEATFARYLETSAWKDFRVNNFDSLFALGAWARCRPSTDLSMQGFLTSQVYQKFVHPFFPNQQPQKSYNSPNEIFIRVGLPFLRERGFLLDASISFVSELASLFLQKNASTAAAWESHKANFGNWLLELQNVQEELTSILSFDRDYPKLQAPGLRNVIGLLSSSGLPLKNLSTDDVQARINILLENASAFKPDKFPGIEHIRMAFEALGDPSIDSDKRKRDREFLTGDLDPGSVNTYCSTLLHELLTTQQHIPLGYFDLELLTGLTGVGDIDVMKEKYAHLYLDLFAGKVAPTTSDIAGIPFDFTAERFSREAAQAFQFSGPSKALYQATRETLLNPKQFESPSALATRKSTLALVLQDAADDIHRKALSLPKAQGDKILYRSNLIKAAIESVAKAQSTSDLLYALCKYSDSDKQLKKHIREVALAVACDSAELKGHEIDALGSQEPSKESIERMYEILQDRVLHNSTIVDGIRDEMPALRAALGIGTLEEELRRLGKIGTRGVESIRAYATRGLLGELAGFIGESCLTRQENLMRRHPNATAIIFVKNADKPGSMRLEGSCFLLTVKDNDGNDVLVIRGLNPTQNLILSLNAASFFEEFLEQVVKPIARKLHIKKIAIPTPQKDIFFEARTNRPSLAVYLTDRCANLPSISFENDRDRAVFNDNSFEKSCVLLWSEPE